MSNKMKLHDHINIKMQDMLLSGDNKNIEGKPLIAILDATHSGFINRNFFFYIPDGMKDTVPTWTAPYSRPVLVHHRMSDGLTAPASDPIGRVSDARFLTDSRGGFTQLDVEIVDEDAKQKIIDGRYLTVSTHIVPVDLVECTQCGTNIFKDGFCGHARGTFYEDEETGEKKLTYWKIGRGSAREVSFVNTPADQTDTHYAGVTQWAFADEEKPDLSSAPDPEENRTILVMKDNIALPDATLISRFKDSPNEDLIVNKSIWESVDGDIDRYVDLGGLLVVDKLTDIGAADHKTTISEGNSTENEDEIELTDEDLAIFDWLRDEVTKELKALDRARYLTTKYKEKGKIVHSHIANINQAGNGYTDYVLGHSHRIVDNKIIESSLNADEKSHSHEKDGLLPNIRSYFDMYTGYVTGYPKSKNSSKHRHTVVTNEAKNGYSDYVLGHSHECVDGKMLPATASGDSKPHTHVLGEEFDLEDQYVDPDTWTILDFADAEMSEKQKKKADKDGKKFCGPHDDRKDRKSFPAHDCAHVRAGLRLLTRYKGPGSKSKIRACLQRQNKKLKCGVSKDEEQLYEVINLLSVVLSKK